MLSRFRLIDTSTANMLGFSFIAYLPIIYITSIFTTILVSYGIAVKNHDIPALLPSISDAGAFCIERHIFCFGISFSCVLALVCGAVRYLQLSLDFSKSNKENQLNVNRLSFVVLIITQIFGLLFAAFEVNYMKRLKGRNFCGI